MPRILVVEDEAAIARVLVDNLVFEGHEAEAVADGAEGLERALAWHAGPHSARCGPAHLGWIRGLPPPARAGSGDAHHHAHGPRGRGGQGPGPGAGSRRLRHQAGGRPRAHGPDQGGAAPGRAAPHRGGAGVRAGADRLRPPRGDRGRPHGAPVPQGLRGPAPPVGERGAHPHAGADPPAGVGVRGLPHHAHGRQPHRRAAGEAAWSPTRRARAHLHHHTRGVGYRFVE